MFGIKKKSNAAAIVADGKLKHIAFIMDGNGRWAKKRGMPREFGHKRGAAVFKRIVEYCGSININIVTVYAFSTENWKRPQHEIEAIMDLLMEYLDFLFGTMAKDDIQVHFLGDKSKFKPEVREKLEKAERDSAQYHKILNVALNYGGRDEIVYAVNKLIKEGKTEITEDDITNNIYSSHCPPPDLIVRTAGEKRLSNFLMWQSAYSEFYFTDVLWPDYTEKDVDEAVKEFYGRQRRFGGI